MEHRAGVIGQYLDLDVPWVDHGLLEIECRIAECRIRLALSRLERVPQRCRVIDPAHPSTATAGDGLDEDREADLLGRCLQLVEIGGRIGAAQGRQAGGPSRGNRLGLIAGQMERGRGRPDEGDAVASTLLGE